MSAVDYCITTMNRPLALERLLFSIAAHRPDAPVHIADQSESFDPTHYDNLTRRLQDAGLKRAPIIHRLPFDCGVSVARNHLADATHSPYKLSLDDDFVFTEDTDVSALVRLLEAHPTAGMAGGAVTRNGRIRHRALRLEIREQELFQVPCEEPFDEFDGLRFKRASFIPLFAVMRRDLFRHLRWDPALKTAGGPHLDFFLRLPTSPYTALFTPDVSIDHPPIDLDESYKRLRLRTEYLRQMLQKHALIGVHTIGGKVFKLS